MAYFVQAGLYKLRQKGFIRVYLTKRKRRNIKLYIDFLSGVVTLKKPKKV